MSSLRKAPPRSPTWGPRWSSPSAAAWPSSKRGSTRRRRWTFRRSLWYSPMPSSPSSSGARRGVPPGPRRRRTEGSSGKHLARTERKPEAALGVAAVMFSSRRLSRRRRRAIQETRDPFLEDCVRGLCLYETGPRPLRRSDQAAQESDRSPASRHVPSQGADHASCCRQGP